MIAADPALGGAAIIKNLPLREKRVLAVGLQERFHGRRPLAAMKHFLAGGVSSFEKSASQRFFKK